MREDINYTRREDDKQDPNDFPQNGYDNPAFQNDGKSTQNGKIKKHKKKEKKDANKKSSKAIMGFFELFSFADGWDILLMVIGILCALGSGTGIPLLTVVFGGMTDSFVHTGIPSNMSNAANSSSCGVAPVTDMQAEITRFCYYFVAIGCAAFVLSFFQIWTFLVSAKRQAMRIRQKFFRAVLHQDMSWFDSNKIGILNNRLTDDINNIHEGLGDKICICVQISSTFLTGIIIGFVHGWKLTLVILSVSPLLALSAIVWSKLIASFTMKELAAYAKAGAVAEEILTAIRTVVAFNGQKNALAKYNANLNEAKKIGIKKSITTNISIGFSQFASCASYALAFWYGTKLTVSEPEVYTIGTVLTIFFAVKVGTFTLVQAAPNMEGIANARAAAFEVYRIINQPRIIDSSSKEGHKPDRLIGHIEFKDIHFSYPSRPDSQILKGLNLKVEAGKTIALVGSSGCGKSTTIQLLQRFYDPQHGEIILDGHDVRTLNVKWLRENIGVVSQEPVLFGTTIGENIRYGREDVTDAEIEQAAKEANAYDFISKLPDKFNTIVGERGSQLSGGQKQRIAIARAIIRNPKILLLDEATSALDTQSEAIVQAALDTARNGRTTIVIAHRLSTIRTADVIAGFQNGVVVEQGSHNELMKTKGIYNSLVMLQNYEDSNKEDGDKECSSDEEEEANSVEGEECNLEEITPNIHTVEGLETLRMQSLQRQSSKRKSKKSSKKQSKAKIPAQKVEEVKEDLPEVSLRRIFALNKPEWLYITIGVIAAAIAAGIFPTFAIIFGKAIGAFQEQDPIKRTHKTDLLSLMFLMLGLISVAAYMIMGFTFGNSGETLTMRIRSLSFKALLRQDIGLFDDHKNAVGVLITRLATDASQVKGITGSRLGFITMTVSTLLAAITVSFIHGWQLTLFILTCIPIMIGTYFIKMVSMGGHASRDQKALEEAGRISTEAVENIRTVVSLTREDTFYERYNTSLSGPYRDALCKAPWYGLTYAIAQAMNFFFNASVFRFGAWLVAHCLMEFQHVFIVFAAVIFSTMSVGHSSSLAPDFGKAKISARRIFQLLDRKPPIDSYSEEGDILSDFKGNIEFKDVHFVYPTRPTAQVLQGLNIKVSRGQTLALVGSSGCGKSTSIQLLERFYDPVEGQVFADGMDIKSLNLKWLRSQLGIVSQEPILFDCSISENIQYGDNSRLVTQEEVEAAALTANIHSFIQELPDGYNTRVGEKGTQLSGGQKQRIAIARALVQKPKVLLLDEATSALDTESEKMVQKALDDARQGRTCIVIAHRLTTVQNADIIAVIENGKVVEHGTHNQLLEKQGAYYALVNSRV